MDGEGCQYRWHGLRRTVAFDWIVSELSSINTEENKVFLGCVSHLSEKGRQTEEVHPAANPSGSGSSGTGENIQADYRNDGDQ